MGLLNRLFKADPNDLLDRAEDLLRRGEAREALRAVERARSGASLAQGTRADQLERRAQDALAEAALEKAELALEAGFEDDAGEWIETALRHVTDEGRQDELRRRADELRRRATAPPEDLDEPGLVVSSDAFLDTESHYLMLVDMLDDDVAQRYEGRPEAFRQAFVDLNEGRTEAAREVLDGLVAEHPGDAVYLLERGRCLLTAGEYAGARADLEAVWEDFGDEPIDLAGSTSVPSLWAEAMHGLGEVEGLLERLDEVADPRHCDVELCRLYGMALLRTERFEDARSYLSEAMVHFPRDPEMPRQLAAALHRLERTPEAIATLERSIAPSCAGGSCNRPPKHVPSLRTLAGLYLDAGGDQGLERAGELVKLIAQAQGGELGAPDYLLLAEYHQRRGDAEASQEAAAEARRLQETAPPELEAAPAAPPPPTSTPGRGGRIL